MELELPEGVQAVDSANFRPLFEQFMSTSIVHA